MHNQELKSVDTAKYLEVTISVHLSWNTHISNITAKAYRTLGFVKRNVQTKNRDTRTLAYNSLKCALKLNQGQQSGALAWRKIKIRLKRFKEGQPDGCQMTTQDTAVSGRWWATLDGSPSKIDSVLRASQCFIKSFLAYIVVVTCIPWLKYKSIQLFVIISICFFPHDCSSLE